jgi:hypothetical protein
VQDLMAAVVAVNLQGAEDFQVAEEAHRHKFQLAILRHYQ